MKPRRRARFISTLPEVYNELETITRNGQVRNIQAGLDARLVSQDTINEVRHLAYLFMHGARDDDGSLVPENIFFAIECYKWAVTKWGDAKSANELGDYHSGKDTPEDTREAEKWYSIAAAVGNSDAQLKLACLYLKGGPIEQNKAKTLFLAIERKVKGSASVHLTSLLLKNETLFSKEEVNEIMGSIEREMESSAIHSLHFPPQALTNFSIIYSQGKHVQKDVRKELRLLQAAAASGNAQAQSIYGRYMMLGTHGEKNMGLAKSWLLEAAQQGHAVAAFNLGVLYHGTGKTCEDIPQAKNWLRNAVAWGYEKGLLQYQKVCKEEARIFLRRGDFKNAKKVLQESKCTEAKFVEAWENLLKNLKESLENMEKLRTLLAPGSEASEFKVYDHIQKEAEKFQSKTFDSLKDIKTDTATKDSLVSLIAEVTNLESQLNGKLKEQRDAEMEAKERERKEEEKKRMEAEEITRKTAEAKRSADEARHRAEMEARENVRILNTRVAQFNGLYDAIYRQDPGLVDESLLQMREDIKRLNEIEKIDLDRISELNSQLEKYIEKLEEKDEIIRAKLAKKAEAKGEKMPAEGKEEAKEEKKEREEKEAKSQNLRIVKFKKAIYNVTRPQSSLRPIAGGSMHQRFFLYNGGLKPEHFPPDQQGYFDKIQAQLQHPKFANKKGEQGVRNLTESEKKSEKIKQLKHFSSSGEEGKKVKAVAKIKILGEKGAGDVRVYLSRETGTNADGTRKYPVLSVCAISLDAHKKKKRP